ncbi:MAG: hypothetical protein K2I93_04310 [Oscillospiraceae bacterium]|nr:hypothetical protein [Oscillospiraceae bacterium]
MMTAAAWGLNTDGCCPSEGQKTARNRQHTGSTTDETEHGKVVCTNLLLIISGHTGHLM